MLLWSLARLFGWIVTGRQNFSDAEDQKPKAKRAESRPVVFDVRKHLGAPLTERRYLRIGEFEMNALH